MAKKFSLYQVLIIGLGLIVVVFPADILRRLVTSTTDQNLFFHPFSNVLFSKDVSPLEGDLIRRGDFLIRIQDTTILNLDTIPANLLELVDVEVGDADSGVRRRVKVHSNELLESLEGIPPSARVIQVQEDGASDRGGLKVGDLIVSINGTGFESIFEADQIMRTIQPGEVAVYHVLRRLDPVDCHIQLADFGIPFSMFFNVLGGILFLIPGLVLGFMGHRLKPARRLSEAFLFFAGFMFLLVLNFSGFDGNTRTYVFFWRTYLGILAITTLIHARWYFPSERNYLTRRKWVLAGPWVLMVVAMVSPMVAGRFFQGQFLVRWLLPICLSLLVAFPVLVRFAYRKNKSARDRKVGLVIRILDYLLILSALVAFIWPPSAMICMGFLFMIPIVYTYTIFDQNLFGMEVQLDRNIQYTIFSTLNAVLVGVAGLLWFWYILNIDLNLPQIYFTENTIELVENEAANASSALFERILLTAVALLSFGILRWIFYSGARFLKRRYHRQGYDYKSAAQQLTDALFNRFNMTSLTKTLAGKLTELMEIRSAGVLVFDGEEIILGERGLRLRQGWHGSSESFDQVLQGLRQFLRTFHGTFSIDYLDAQLKKQFGQAGIQYISPIRSQNEPLGCLLIGPKRADTCLDAEDFNFLKAAAGQSAMAIENALLYHKLASQERMKHELEIARKVQLSSLPQQTPSIDRFDVSADSIPALEVGGDYFDFLEVTEDKIHLILADVSGKGTSAAFYMSKIQGVFRALAFNNLGPRKMLLQANPIIYNSMEKKSFVTALGLELDSRHNRARFSRAGHVGLYHYSSQTGQTTIHQPSGLAIGVCNTALFEDKLEEQELPFHDGDVFVLISDGLSEALNVRRQPFGEERIAEIISEQCSGSAGEVKAEILREIQEFSVNAPQHDDQTLVVVKVKDLAVQAIAS